MFHARKLWGWIGQQYGVKVPNLDLLLWAFVAWAYAAMGFGLAVLGLPTKSDYREYFEAIKVVLMFPIRIWSSNRSQRRDMLWRFENIADGERNFQGRGFLNMSKWSFTIGLILFVAGLVQAVGAAIISRASSL